MDVYTCSNENAQSLKIEVLNILNGSLEDYMSGFEKTHSHAKNIKDAIGFIKVGYWLGASVTIYSIRELGLRVVGETLGGKPLRDLRRGLLEQNLAYLHDVIIAHEDTINAMKKD